MSVVPSVVLALLSSWIVDDAKLMSPPAKVWRLLQVFVVVVAGKSPATASRARLLVKYRLVAPSAMASVVVPARSCAPRVVV